MCAGGGGGNKILPAAHSSIQKFHNDRYIIFMFEMLEHIDFTA